MNKIQQTYETLESQVDDLESIENWTEKVNKMKIVKESIATEQEKLNNLANTIFNDDIVKPDKKKLNLDKLVNSFKQAKTLDNKIKYFNLIRYHISEVEKELFD